MDQLRGKEPFSPFEKQKITYFSQLGFRMRKGLQAHKAFGLWDKKVKEEGSFKNVTKHCLMQVARAGELATVLELSPQIHTDIMIGAVLHDVNKKQEIHAAETAHATEKSVWDAFEEATRIKNERLKQTGFTKEEILLSNAAPYGSIPLTEEILKKDTLSEHELAFLMLHYIDDISIGDRWVEPNEQSEEETVNQLDRRLTPPTSRQPVYQQLDEEGKQHFEGESTWQAARRVGHLLEDRLAKLVSEKTGIPLNPKDLPTFIDSRVKQAIQSTPSNNHPLKQK